MAFPFFGGKEKAQAKMPEAPAFNAAAATAAANSANANKTTAPGAAQDQRIVITGRPTAQQAAPQIQIRETPKDAPKEAQKEPPRQMPQMAQPARSPAPAQTVSVNIAKPITEAPRGATAAQIAAAQPAEQLRNPVDVENVTERKTDASGREITETGELKSDTFYLDLRPKVIKLPPYENKKQINVRYPLIAPFAYAHIFWDDRFNELMYEIEEPTLDATEKELLELIRIGLEEMINISYVRAAKSNVILEYLEKNVQSILVELGTKVSKKSYQKLMYYVYRDAVGLNEIEPMLNDYYVEDIECNGVKFPIYIVHRKYQNLRTNIIFNELPKMTDFVEKLAQKTGRYISYAKPLLDGTLPDGSRVNATYTEDITTRGPTFTIRKFTKEPWTPIHLIQSKTSTAESFAYLWLVIEHKFNVMVVGETASGKTTFLNCIVDFIPPEARICSIEDTRELNLAHLNWLPAVTRAGFGMPTIVGTQYGEITLFDLLRETFRQNPDYVIVGEVRGNEAYVLFQGMASGHPSFSTFHAASVETVIKRLETPPISLSPSLVEALDVICICIHVKDQKKNVRRLKEIDEIEEISQELGKAKYNAVLEWDTVKDNFQVEHKEKSKIFPKICRRTGMTLQQVYAEFRLRTAVLNKMAEQNIVNFDEFNKVINDYYKDPDAVLKRFGIR